MMIALQSRERCQFVMLQTWNFGELSASEIVLRPGLPESLEQPTGTYLFICLHYRDPVVTEEGRGGGRK